VNNFDFIIFAAAGHRSKGQFDRSNWRFSCPTHPISWPRPRQIFLTCQTGQTASNVGAIRRTSNIYLKRGTRRAA